MTVLFISDLHLDGSRPEATECFLRFLEGPAQEAERLYILGDLFEAWIGDDDPNPHFALIREALKRFTQDGPPTFFMPGNRDFLMGDKFLDETGLVRLPDPTLIEVAGTSVLLSHGDALCTDDTAYQRYRRFTRHRWVLKLYHALPFAIRSWIVTSARSKSQSSTQSKAPEVMDVNQQAVEQMMRTYNMLTLLHGHTHRQGEHDFQIESFAAKRIVLGDWYERGAVLSWGTQGRQFKALSFG